MGCTRVEIAEKVRDKVALKYGVAGNAAWKHLIYEAALQVASKEVVIQPLQHEANKGLLGRLRAAKKEEVKKEIVKSTKSTPTTSNESVSPINLVKEKGKILNKGKASSTDTVKVNTLEQLTELAIQLDNLMDMPKAAVTNERWASMFKELGVQTTFTPLTIKLVHDPVKKKDGSQDLAVATGNNHIQIATNYDLYKAEDEKFGKAKPLPFRILLHEYVHTITQNALVKHPENDTVKKLVSLYDRIKNNEKLKGERGIVNVSEFVAEALANPRFQSKLDKIGSEHTIVNKIKELFKTLLAALKKEGDQVTALDEVLDLTATLLKEDVNKNSNAKAKYNQNEGTIQPKESTATSLVEAAKGCAK